MKIIRDMLTQIYFKPPIPDTDFSGKTIIVTGANVGLAKVAARHFVRLKADKVILAVRSISKGEAAKADIEATTERLGIVDVYELDYSSYASVKVFAVEVAKLTRVDIVILNAGVATEKFDLTEDDENTISQYLELNSLAR